MKKDNLILGTFASVFKFILLLFLCVGSGFLIVVPLWYFSSYSPEIYTITALSITSGFIIWKIIRVIIKSRPQSIVKTLLNLIFIMCGAILSVKSVFNEEKLIALLIILISIFLCIISTIIINRFFKGNEE